MVGRFIGAALMQKIRPGLMQGLFATLAVTMVISSAGSTGLAALLLLQLVGLCNSIMFPTIFTLRDRAVGRRQASRQWHPLHGHRGWSRYSSNVRCPGRRLRIRIGLASSRGVMPTSPVSDSGQVAWTWPECPGFRANSCEQRGLKVSQLISLALVGEQTMRSLCNHSSADCCLREASDMAKKKKSRNCSPTSRFGSMDEPSSRVGPKQLILAEKYPKQILEEN